MANDRQIIWTPLPGSQTLALCCPADVIFYSGTRGPGKSDAQLMRFRKRVGLGYKDYWRGVIFDREYKNLDDLIAKSIRWWARDKHARFNQSKGEYRWHWDTGEELVFRAIKKESDYWNYHGQEFPFIGWNELPKYPKPTLFDALMSCNRSGFIPEQHPQINRETGETYYLPDIPLEVFATGNPFGVGHNWVKKRFVSIAPNGKIVRKVTNVFNPRTQEREDVVRSQVHIYGSYVENKYLSPAYIAELYGTADTVKRRAWLNGDWDIASGGMFDDIWDAMYNVVEPFRIPNTWRIYRSFDYGWSKPFSVGWWAESDGSDVELATGDWVSTIRGDMIRVHEWYGTNGETNTGLKLMDYQITQGIIEREIALGIYGRVTNGPADNSIWDAVNGKSIADGMAKPVVINGKQYPGVQWERSDKSPGSRKAGWKVAAKLILGAQPQRIKGQSLPREYPGLFVFDTCEHFLTLFPSLPRSERDPDDVETDSEDHIGDESRYMFLHGSYATDRTRGLL